MHARRWRQHTAASTASFDGWGRASIHVSSTQSHGRETAGQHPYVRGNFGRPHLPHSMPLPFHTSPLEDGSGAEDQVLHFLAFDLTTWVPRIWNDVISGVLVDLRCAYSYYLHRGDAQF
ncbi:hypothetical protein TcG_02849, partial [Trypanosoma cruzi]